MIHRNAIGGIAAALFLLLAQALPARAGDSVSPGDLQEIRALFLRYAAGESAHDIDAIDATLVHAAPGQPDPVGFVGRAYRFWGREAVMQHFREIFRGTWRAEPELEAMRIIPLGADTAQIFVPTRITFAPGGTVTTQLFLINKLVLRTAEGWRIAVTVTAPGQ